MTIIKALSHVDAYRAKASATDINELSGRTGRPDLTRFVTDQILAKLPISGDCFLVDIGCGDGFLLKRIVEGHTGNFSGRLIGILPTEEEVVRVRDNLQLNDTDKGFIAIRKGLSVATGLADCVADLVVCNGVFLILEDISNVHDSLTEIYRIAKPGATIFIGEIPASDEMADKKYGDSISGWLFWVLRNQGVLAFLLRLRQACLAFFSKEPFIVAPKKLFHMEPNDFSVMLHNHGFSLVDHYQHKEVDLDGKIGVSKTRWDYVIKKN